jgi:SAM-dependent methyltransferase
MERIFSMSGIRGMESSGFTRKKFLDFLAIAGTDLIFIGKGDRRFQRPVRKGKSMKEIDVKKVVREKYGEAARTGSSCCGPAGSCDSAADVSTRIGYSETELQSIPEGANLGLGCGNPTALASLKPGETVLDLGSGAGIDCFLTAKEVGETGTAIGVDMTPEMVYRARENAKKAGIRNVEFRLGELEHLPVADGSVDVVISNCVINLVPDKRKVFAEMYRVLKPGGRFFISDIVLEREFPEPVRSSVEAYTGCVAGASLRRDYLRFLGEAGFGGIRILGETPFSIPPSSSPCDLSYPTSPAPASTATSLQVSGIKS